jgi:S1-C subfamily serine protease
MRDINSDLAEEYDLDQIKGVYVDEVLKESAAEKAGLQKGDVVTAINGIEVNSGSQIQEQISKFRPSDKVQVQYIRKGKTANVTATLRDRSGSTDVIVRAENADVDLGVVFSPVSDQLKNRLRLENGVQVREVLQGKFRKAGIQEGFIIVRIDKQYVESGADVQKILKDAKGAVLIEGIYPNGVRYAYALQM